MDSIKRKKKIVPVLLITNKPEDFPLNLFPEFYYSFKFISIYKLISLSKSKIHLATNNIEYFLNEHLNDIKTNGLITELQYLEHIHKRLELNKLKEKLIKIISDFKEVEKIKRKIKFASNHEEILKLITDIEKTITKQGGVNND